MIRLLVFFALLFATAAHAQSVRQSGNVTPGHPVMWTKDGVIADGGVPAIPYLTGLGVMAQGPGICQNSAAVSGPYNQICLSVSATATQFIVNNFGGATGAPTLVWNGTQYPLIAGGANNLPTLGSPAALAAAVIPMGVNAIHVTRVSGTPLSGYNAAGVSTCGLTYNIGTGVATGVYGEVLNTPSSIYWEPDYSQSPVRACEFGAIGDGSFNQITGAITGTDNTAIIQAAFDYALQNGFEAVCLNDGLYKTTDTLQMGWGQSFYSLSLIACNMGNHAFFGMAGVTILPTKTDRCAVNIQGARHDAIRYVAFWGQNYPWITQTSFLSNGSAFPSVNSSWFNPALIPAGSNPGGLQQHSPYAAICIDAYSSAQPTDHYPTVVYPAWTGVGSTQYNKAFSSDIVFEHLQISGFAVGINSKPNGDGNGDFVQVHDLDCEQSVYCVSIGNTQSRNVSLTNVFGNQSYAILTNNQFGLQQGELDGPISNINCGECYELFQIGAMSIMGPFIADNLYTEATVRIGSFTGSASTSQGIRLTGCNINLDESVTGLLPAAMIENSGTAYPIILDQCSIAGASRIPVLVHGANTGVTINGGTWSNANQMATLFGTTAAQLAINFTGSVFAGSAATFPGFSPSFGKLTFLNPTNAVYFTNPTTVGSQYMGSDAYFISFRAQLSQSVTGFNDSLNGRRWNFALTQNQVPMDLSGSATSVKPAFSCDVLTFTYESFLQTPFNINTINVGDVLYHANTGTLFFVSAVGAPDGSGNYPITAQQLNNMYVNQSTFSCTTNNISDSTLAGNTFLYHTTITDIPQVVFFGTFTSGNTSVTNVQRGDGFGGNLNTYVQNGDRYYAYFIQDSYFQWPYPYGTTLSAVTNGSPGTLSLSANSTQSGRFPLLPLPITGGPQ